MSDEVVSVESHAHGAHRLDFNPRVRTKPGKVRRAIVIQDDIFNHAGHPSTLVVPTTTRLVDTDTPLRLRLLRGTAGLDRDGDVLVAQVIAVANESFRKELGELPADVARALGRQLRLVRGL